MKNIWKPAVAAFALLAFTACDNNDNRATESETMETEEVDMNTDMEMQNDLEEDTTVVVQDEPVNDGVADEIQEEKPPIE